MELVITYDLHTITAQTTKRGGGYGFRYRIDAEDWVYQHADHRVPMECLALDMAIRSAKFLINQRGKNFQAVIERGRAEQLPEERSAPP